MSHRSKLTGEDLLRYLNKIESVVLNVSASARSAIKLSTAKCLHFLALQHGGQNS